MIYFGLIFLFIVLLSLWDMYRTGYGNLLGKGIHMIDSIGLIWEFLYSVGYVTIFFLIIIGLVKR